MPNPNITVNNNSSPNENNFNPTPYPSSGNISPGSSVSFRAAGSSSINFYAYQMNGSTVVRAFTSSAWPYSAPKASDAPAPYQLKSTITGTVTLSLTDPEANVAGLNGTINVGNGGGNEPP
jgi:hypothetical protein